MVTDTGKIRPVVNENRRTYYKLHPNQDKYPGAVITMLNLPNDAYHWELWQKKGYKLSPQELMPDMKLEKIEEGEYKFIVSPSSTIEQKKVCEVCGRECIGEFGLNSHKKSHEKDKK